MFAIQADPEADAVYIYISETPVAYSKEITEDAAVDYAADGTVIGIDILNFSAMTSELQWAAGLRA